jgi:hypothetical protein
MIPAAIATAMMIAHGIHRDFSRFRSFGGGIFDRSRAPMKPPFGSKVSAFSGLCSVGPELMAYG